MLFLKSSQVFLFIYLFFNESATQSYILIAATIMNWLQWNSWRGEDNGPLLPLPSSILTRQSLSWNQFFDSPKLSVSLNVQIVRTTKYTPALHATS